MTVTWTLEAILLGVVSSLHCAGMCGPLMFALPIRDAAPARRLVSLVVYHGGRILTYGGLGLIFGLAGRRIQMAGFQQWFSILLGVAILITVGWQTFGKQVWQPAVIKRFHAAIGNMILKLWKAPGLDSLFLLGIANGLLPCGMVYLAVAISMTSGTAGAAMLYMIFFGVGTLPMLLAVSYAGSFLSAAVRNHFKKAVPYIIGCIGLLLILRGLDLGIPFISPVLATARSGVITCH